MNLRTYLMIKMAKPISGPELVGSTGPAPEAEEAMRARRALATLNKKQRAEAMKNNGGSMTSLVDATKKKLNPNNARLEELLGMRQGGRNELLGLEHMGFKGGISPRDARLLTDAGYYSNTTDALRDMNNRQALSFLGGKYRGLKADTVKNLESLGKTWGTYGGGAAGLGGGYILGDLAARAGGFDDDGSWAGTGLRLGGAGLGAAGGALAGRSFGPAMALKYLPK